MAPPGRWRQTVQIGLLWGVGAVFISLVGLVEALQPRQIITGVISGGHALLLVVAIAAGAFAARQYPDTARRLAAGAVAGAIVGAFVAVLVLLARVVNVRAMIVGATPELFGLLTLGRGPKVLPWIVLCAAGLAVAGVILSILPRQVRSIVTTGAVTLLGVGLLQEQVQLLLQSDRVARFREIVFTFDGLTSVGAGLVVV